MAFKAGPRFSKTASRGLLLAVFLLACGASAQQESELAIQAASPPKAFLRWPYHFQLKGEAGVTPLKWQLTEGQLPAGLGLSEDGTIAGAPTEIGEFHFTVTVRDSGSPAHERSAELNLQVAAPLSVRWGRDPKVSGKRIEGTVKVSNPTGQDFDLTVIVVAVNENGRATALGYQRFTLKSNTLDMEIPFGENLSPGSYEVNADVVGEVPSANMISRARLTTRDKLTVAQGP